MLQFNFFHLCLIPVSPRHALTFWLQEESMLWCSSTSAWWGRVMLLLSPGLTALVLGWVQHFQKYIPRRNPMMNSHIATILWMPMQCNFLTGVGVLWFVWRVSLLIVYQRSYRCMVNIVHTVRIKVSTFKVSGCRSFTYFYHHAAHVRSGGKYFIS